MTSWPQLSPAKRMELMTIDTQNKVSIVIDSDTFNEIDVQIAMAWAMLHPERIDLL